MSEADQHISIVSPVVIEHEFLATLGLSDNLHGDLLFGNDMLVGQVNRKVNLELCPESV